MNDTLHLPDKLHTFFKITFLGGFLYRKVCLRHVRKIHGRFRAFKETSYD